MGIFMPQDCSIDWATSYWLLAAMGALTLAGIVLVAQVVMIWRRGTQAQIGWWRRLPLVVPAFWAVICGLLVLEAWGYYRDVTAPLAPCPPPAICSRKGLCLLVGSLGTETQVALLVTAVALVLGWFALSRIPRLS